jgi:hypothetical protein
MIDAIEAEIVPDGTTFPSRVAAHALFKVEKVEKRR